MFLHCKHTLRERERENLQFFDCFMSHFGLFELRLLHRAIKMLRFFSVCSVILALVLQLCREQVFDKRNILYFRYLSIRHKIIITIPCKNTGFELRRLSKEKKHCCGSSSNSNNDITNACIQTHIQLKIYSAYK